VRPYARDELGDRLQTRNSAQLGKRKSPRQRRAYDGRRLHLATGLLLPIWDKLPDDHVQVIRIAASDGSSLLGREIPTPYLSELGTKLGLDFKLGIAPQELAGTILASGRSQPFRGVEEVILSGRL
jgi:hypothetical protein